MIDDNLSRWLARLPLCEQVAARRHEEQADTFVSHQDPRIAKPTRLRCRCCNGILKDHDKLDPAGRCKTCRLKRRLERKGLRSTADVES
jgi:hypothetical protein